MNTFNKGILLVLIVTLMSSIFSFPAFASGASGETAAIVEENIETARKLYQLGIISQQEMEDIEAGTASIIPVKWGGAPPYGVPGDYTTYSRTENYSNTVTRPFTHFTLSFLAQYIADKDDATDELPEYFASDCAIAIMDLISYLKDDPILSNNTYYVTRTRYTSSKYPECARYDCDYFLNSSKTAKYKAFSMTYYVLYI